MKYNYKFYTLDNQFIEETSDFPLNFTGIVEFPNGTKSWLHDGLYHRLDGPAYEDVDGYKEWSVNGKVHRLGGPAVEHPNGTKWWYVDDEEITEEQHNLLHCIMKLKELI